ncbi:DUF4339 domain-containing protein [Prosthecobacter sp.]|uniref:DUF4339 domain-containing protein n=1 Tax=Prosthecobacter sp. TaxID=1965333 RepID=UPI00378385F8
METPRTLWLSRDGVSEPTGPFTEGQISTMWNAGQITANGMVAAEGDGVWTPIRELAGRWTAPLPPQGPKGGRVSIAQVVIGLGVCMAVVLLALASSGDPRLERAEQEQKREAVKKAWTSYYLQQNARNLGRQIEEYQKTPRGQELMRELEAEKAKEAAAEAARRAQTERAFEKALHEIPETSPMQPPPALGQ